MKLFGFYFFWGIETKPVVARSASVKFYGFTWLWWSVGIHVHYRLTDGS